jgi:hypothetical protein
MESQVKEKNEGRTGLSLAEAKKYLQRNDLSEIAIEAHVSRQTVSGVLHGRTKNFKVAEKIISRAEVNKAIVERGNSI